MGIFTVTMPYVFITFWVSQQKGTRVLFNIATCLFIGCIGNTNAAMAEVFVPQFPLIKPLTRIISFLLIYLLLRKFCKSYLHMLYLLKQGWLILCLVPLTAFFTFIFITNSILRTDPYPSFVIMYGLIIVCGCAYSLIYLFFEKVYQEYEIQVSSDLLSAQIYALIERIAAVQSMEEGLRIERHDLRHRLQTIATLLDKDDKITSLEYIGKSQKFLNELKHVRWCSNPILDATLGAYFKKAETSGIEIETSLIIPNELPVDAAELSIVFANALTNAIGACLLLPIGQRKIICRCISSPQLMFEVSNTYTGDIKMDAHGIPIAAKQNYGIGTRSIVAFTKKHNAYCDYEAKDGWFSLRIML